MTWYFIGGLRSATGIEGAAIPESIAGLQMTRRSSHRAPAAPGANSQGNGRKNWFASEILILRFTDASRVRFVVGAV
jgi:hypothetical protein